MKDFKVISGELKDMVILAENKRDAGWILKGLRALANPPAAPDEADLDEGTDKEEEVVPDDG